MLYLDESRSAAPQGWSAPRLIGVLGLADPGSLALLRKAVRCIAEDIPLGVPQGKAAPEGGLGTYLHSGAQGARRKTADGPRGFAEIRPVAELEAERDVLSAMLREAAWPRGRLAALFGPSCGAEVRRAKAILERLGIAPITRRRIGALSDGQRQKVAIASALMRDPRLVLAGDPIRGLDAMNQRGAMETLRRLAVEDGRVVVAGLSCPVLARRYCDRIVGVRADGAVFDWPPGRPCAVSAPQPRGAAAALAGLGPAKRHSGGRGLAKVVPLRQAARCTAEVS